MSARRRRRASRVLRVGQPLHSAKGLPLNPLVLTHTFPRLDKSFLSLEEAQAFVAGKKIKSTSGEPEPPKFYAVAKGAFTGIFTDWDQASKAIKGQKGPKYKKFPTREEAVQFIKEWGDADAIAALGEKVSDAESSDEDDSDEEDDELDVDGDRLEVEESSGAGKKKKGKAVLDVYTDGSSLKNGRAGAAAGVGVFFGIGDTRFVNPPRPRSRCFAVHVHSLALRGSSLDL